MTVRLRRATAIDVWIARDLQRFPPKARSLVVTVWGDAIAPHGGAIWLSGLIRLMQPLGLSERLVRTSVYRLGQQGWLTAKQDGRRSLYALTEQGKRRFEHAYQRIYAPPTREWNGTWDLVVVPPSTLGAEARRTLRTTLTWDGYAMVAPGVFARPARKGENVDDDVGIAKAARHGDIAVLAARQSGRSGERSLASLALPHWDLKRIAAEYRSFTRRFAPVVRAFANGGATPEQCFVVRILLIHAYRRVTLHDPLLPPDLLPAQWPSAAAYALCRDFYTLTHKRAEQHLGATLETAQGPLPPAADYFRARFDGLT